MASALVMAVFFLRSVCLRTLLQLRRLDLEGEGRGAVCSQFLETLASVTWAAAAVGRNYELVDVDRRE